MWRITQGEPRRGRSSSYLYARTAMVACSTPAWPGENCVLVSRWDRSRALRRTRGIFVFPRDPRSCCQNRRRKPGTLIDGENGKSGKHEKQSVDQTLKKADCMTSYVMTLFHIILIVIQWIFILNLPKIFLNNLSQIKRQFFSKVIKKTAILFIHFRT